MPSANGQSNTKDALFHDGKAHLHPPNEVRYASWGIFDIAYDAESPPLLFLPTPTAVNEFFRLLVGFTRFLNDLWVIAPSYTLRYYLYTVLLGLETSVSLLLASDIVYKVERLFQEQQKKEGNPNSISISVLAWLSLGVLSSYLEHDMIDLRAELGGRLRAHFLPRLVQANLEWDVNEPNESRGCFPYPYDYGHFIPGWDFLELPLVRLRYICALILEVLCLMYVTFRFEDPVNAKVLSSLLVLFLATKLFTPKNRAGGAGYTFWTSNEHYKRLMVLFNIVFDFQYRFILVKDGLVDHFSKEYKRVSELLGVVKADTTIVGLNPPAPWQRVLSRDLLVKYPVAVSAVFVPWASKSILGILVIFQLAISKMDPQIDHFRSNLRANTFVTIFKKVQEFYQILDRAPPDQEYSCQFNSDTKGCKITISDVSYSYPSSSIPAISQVNLTIGRSQFIVITGPNGGGKTSLAKVLTGFMQPTGGKVSIDDIKVQPPMVRKFRQAMAFITQHEEMYPVSLRENLLFGLTNETDRCLVKEADLDVAVRLGGAVHLIERCGYDAVLNPVTITSESIEDPAGQAAIAARDRFSPMPVRASFSTAERQRLMASRAFLRILHGNIKLIVLDEPFSALDPLAESQILKEFRQIAAKNSQTLIVITHRLVSVAHHADLIVYMNNRKVEEQGTHVELIKSKGPYSALYKAQTLNTS